jgi:hypothetical protein
MTALARALSLSIGKEVDAEVLKTVVIFCGFGLAVSLLVAAAASSSGLLMPDPGALDLIAWI